MCQHTGSLPEGKHSSCWRKGRDYSVRWEKVAHGMRCVERSPLKLCRTGCLLVMLLGAVLVLESCGGQLGSGETSQRNETTGEQAQSSGAQASICPPEEQVLEGVYHPERLVVQD